ncbi:MAG: recombinase family protein [Cyanobacteria bacterium RI_101]|nr:recombinase family protein [Cyanobacteria bacterium RI_101]
MGVVIYHYQDPLLDPAPSVATADAEAVYLDFGGRAEWARLLADLQARPDAFLWLSSLGDLGDSPEEIGARLSQLQALGVRGKCLAEDKSLADLAPGLTWSELEQLQDNQQSRRLRRGHARKRRQGLPPPGKAPYGYRKTPERYVLDRSAAPLVKTFCEQFLRLGSLRGAVRYLAQNYGKKISLTTARRWLTHPVYRGDLLYQNKIIIPNTHNPILSREDGAQIDRLLGQNRSRPPRSASAPRALAGLVHCPLCQSLWVVNALKKPRPYLYLRPQTCPQAPKCAALNYDAVLEAVIAQICAQLPQAAAQSPAANLTALKSQLEGEMDRRQTLLTQLPQLLESGILDADTLALRRYTLQQELAQLRQRLDRLPPGELTRLAPALSLPQFWLDLSELERRFYLREFVREIQLRRRGKSWDAKVEFSFMPPRS